MPLLTNDGAPSGTALPRVNPGVGVLAAVEDDLIGTAITLAPGLNYR
jgi:hypothetical protein